MSEFSELGGVTGFGSIFLTKRTASYRVIAFLVNMSMGSDPGVRRLRTQVVHSGIVLYRLIDSVAIMNADDGGYVMAAPGLPSQVSPFLQFALPIGGILVPSGALFSISIVGGSPEDFFQASVLTDDEERKA